MSCASIENPMMAFDDLVNSVNNPPGQPMQDIALETTARRDGGQVGEPGQDNPRNGEGQGRDGQGQISPDQSQAALGAAVRMTSEELSVAMVMMLGAVVVLSTSAVW